MPPDVEKIAKTFLKRPAVVTIGEAGGTARSVTQIVEYVTESQKRDRLLSILNEGTYAPPIIIFVNQKKGVDILAKNLDRLGFKATTLHGGKAQDIREVSLAQLKQGAKDVLVATDVSPC